LIAAGLIVIADDVCTLGGGVAILVLVAEATNTNATLTRLGAAVEITLVGAVGVLPAGGAEAADAGSTFADLIDQGALIDDAVTVVVDAVTGLGCVGVDVSVTFVAVELTVGARAHAEAVSVLILAGALPSIHARAVAAPTVVVDAVPADLGSVAVNPRVGVVAIISLAPAAVPITIFVDVTTVLAEPENVPIAVLVDSISRDISRAGVDLWVGVVAVVVIAAAGPVIAVGAGAEAVVVAVDAIGRAAEVAAVTVLIDAVAANLRLPRVHLGVSIVTVSPSTTGAPSKTVQIVVGAVAQAGGITPVAVVIHRVAADLAPTGVGAAVFVVTVPTIASGIRVTRGVLIAITVGVHAWAVSSATACTALAVTDGVAIGQNAVTIAVDVRGPTVFAPARIDVSVAVSAVAAASSWVRIAELVLVSITIAVGTGTWRTAGAVSTAGREIRCGLSRLRTAPEGGDQNQR